MTKDIVIGVFNDTLFKPFSVKCSKKDLLSGSLRCGIGTNFIMTMMTCAGLKYRIAGQQNSYITDCSDSTRAHRKRWQWQPRHAVSENIVISTWTDSWIRSRLWRDRRTSNCSSTSTRHYISILCPVESVVDSSVPMFMKIFEKFKVISTPTASWIQSHRRPINCPSGSKLSWSFQNFHEHKDNCSHSRWDTVYFFHDEGVRPFGWVQGRSTRSHFKPRSEFSGHGDWSVPYDILRNGSAHIWNVPYFQTFERSVRVNFTVGVHFGSLVIVLKNTVDTARTHFSPLKPFSKELWTTYAMMAVVTYAFILSYQYRQSHSTISRFVRYENFEKFEIILTPMGSWIRSRLRRDQIQLPIGVEIISIVLLVNRRYN